MKGRIIRLISNQYAVLLEDGTTVNAMARGKLRLGKTPLAGDEVEVEVFEDKYGIEKIYDRQNSLRRPPIANVDQALIVMSVKEPDFSFTLVDRLIFLISYEGIEPVILLTKTDLGTPDECARIIDEYRDIGYQVLTNRDPKEEIQKLLEGKITVLCGQSGVGKSTLLNMLDASFLLPTQPISKALGRGKHTTRHTELYDVLGGKMADTPGFSSLEFGELNSYALAGLVPEFQKAGECRFPDCRHLKEPGCRVMEGIQKGIISSIRYDNYKAVIPLCDQIKEWEKK